MNNSRALSTLFEYINLIYSTWIIHLKSINLNHIILYHIKIMYIYIYIWRNGRFNKSEKLRKNKWKIG